MKWINAVLCLLLLLSLYMRWFGSGGLAEQQEKAIQLEALQELNRQLTERNSQLAAEVADLKQGMDAIEERARSELGMVKPGETFIQVINRTEQEKTP